MTNVEYTSDRANVVHGRWIFAGGTHSSLYCRKVESMFREVKMKLLIGLYILSAMGILMLIIREVSRW